VDVGGRDRERQPVDLTLRGGRGRPSRIRVTSVEVPPMSNAIRSVIPTARATAAAPHAPAAGPDSSVWTGSRAAIAASKVPPPERITSTRPS
jgi:hypothetical protein